MLNPELIKYYGDSCMPFFNELVGRVDTDVIDKCYAIMGLKVESGNLCGPQFVGVISDRDTVRVVDDHCLHITLDLKDKRDERDICIGSVRRTKESVKEDGIKIWV